MRRYRADVQDVSRCPFYPIGVDMFRMAGTSIVPVIARNWAKVRNVQFRLDEVGITAAYIMVEKGRYARDEMDYATARDIVLMSVSRCFPDWREMIESCHNVRYENIVVEKVIKTAVWYIGCYGPDYYEKWYKVRDDVEARRLLNDQDARKNLDDRIARKALVATNRHIADFMPGLSRSSRAVRVAPYVRKAWTGCKCPSHY